MSPSSLALSVAAVLLVACAPSGTSVRTVRQPDLPGSAVGFSRPPVIDGSRTACILPPYTPPVDATALANGTPARRDKGGRRWTISLPGETTVSHELAGALVERLRAQGGVLRYISYGLYCGEHDDIACLSYRANLCETNVDEVATTILAAIAADPVLPTPHIDLAVSLAGALGPRCETADDPACAPRPYEDGVYDPGGERHAGPLASHSAGACRHDGDCKEAGCGNHCISWEYGGANEAATCEGYVFNEPVFCGCVEGACAWFTQ
jgi:hypothetical protein